MTTFAGAYIQEPSDLQVVCTEADMISVCDDPGKQDARDYLDFASLTIGNPTAKAEIVAVMNSLIVPVEDTINSYARRQGYAIPLSPVDPLVKDLAARLLWIDARQRAKGLTSMAAEAERSGFIKGTLNDLATGKLKLTAARNASAPAPASNVYKISTAASRDTDGSVVRISRKRLEGF